MASGVTDRFRLDGKTVVVTGAGPGIGSHVSRAYASVGARIVVCARNADRVRALADEIVARGGRAVGVPGDIGAKETIDRVLATANDEFGSVDVIFHNAAAGTGQHAGCSLDLSEDDWTSAINVNLLAPFRLAQAVVPGMRACGSGSVINVLSTAAFTPVTTVPLAAYGATKAALAMLTRYLAKECAPEVRVNAICPGTIAADLESAKVRSGQRAWEALMSQVPLERVGQAEEVVGAALYLASEASSYVTGQVMFVDGGRVNAA